MLAMMLSSAHAQPKGKAKAAAPPEPQVEAPLDTLPPPGPPPAPVTRLRLMLLDVADLREPERSDGFAAPKTVFRHTFGSQRQTAEVTAPPVAINPEALEADIVVIRGIVNPRNARRMFPARDWRFVQGRTPPAPETRVRTLAPPARPEPTTAVAMWLQPGARFGGVDPLTSPAAGASPGAALRMTSGLGTLWVLAAAAPCKDPPTSSTACKPIDDWLTGKVGLGALAAVGGVLPPFPATQIALPAQKLSKPGPKGAVPVPVRQSMGSITLTAADAGGRCGGDATSAPALHLRHVTATGKPPPKVAGWMVQLERLAPPQAAAPTAQAGGTKAPQAPPPRPAACVLLLDIEAG